MHEAGLSNWFCPSVQWKKLKLRVIYRLKMIAKPDSNIHAVSVYLIATEALLFYASFCLIGDWRCSHTQGYSMFLDSLMLMLAKNAGLPSSVCC